MGLVSVHIVGTGETGMEIGACPIRNLTPTVKYSKEVCRHEIGCLVSGQSSHWIRENPVGPNLILSLNYGQWELIHSMSWTDCTSTQIDRKETVSQIDGYSRYHLAISGDRVVHWRHTREIVTRDRK